MSKEFKTATFREIRAQGLCKQSSVYALAVKVDVFGGGQEIICFVNGEGVLDQIERTLPKLREEFERLKKDGAAFL